jgi:hypothetical protein
MDILWDQDCEPEWQARMAGLPYPALRQSWTFGTAMQGLGASVQRAVIFDAGVAVAAAQVLHRRGLRLIGQGPVWLATLEPGQKRRVLRQLARFAGACIATPHDPVVGFGIVPLITPKCYAIWNIDMPPAELRQNLHGKWRNRLLRAEEGCKPVVLTRPKLQELVAYEAAQRVNRGYKNLPGMMAINWPGGELAIGWLQGGELQAGMVFLIHDGRATYFLGWANQAARACFAHGPLLWQAALMLRARGVTAIDLGDVNSETGASLARFKLGTGAEVFAAGATSLVLP